VTVALGCLTTWHVYLISQGETSIERLSNKRERSRLKNVGVKYSNPYDHGFIGNWKQLFAVKDLK